MSVLPSARAAASSKTPNPRHPAPQAELASLTAATKAAAGASPQLALPAGDAARLRALLSSIEQQVGGGSGAATAQEYQVRARGRATRSA